MLISDCVKNCLNQALVDEAIKVSMPEATAHQILADAVARIYDEMPDHPQANTMLEYETALNQAVQALVNLKHRRLQTLTSSPINKIVLN